MMRFDFLFFGLGYLAFRCGSRRAFRRGTRSSSNVGGGILLFVLGVLGGSFFGMLLMFFRLLCGFLAFLLLIFHHVSDMFERIHNFILQVLYGRIDLACRILISSRFAILF